MAMAEKVNETPLASELVRLIHQRDTRRKLPGFYTITDVETLVRKNSPPQFAGSARNVVAAQLRALVLARVMDSEVISGHAMYWLRGKHAYSCDTSTKEVDRG